MENIKQVLIDRMREKLKVATQHQPGSVAMAIPLGPCAEAAMEVLSQGMRIPTIPAYRPEMAAERRWYGAITTDQLDNGAQYPVLSVVRDGDQVLVHLSYGEHEIDVRMLETDGADFGLSVASAAYADSQPAPAAPPAPNVESEL